MEISIVDNVLDFNSSVANAEEIGNIEFIEKIDDGLVHICYDGKIVAIAPTDTLVNGLNFTNADDFINYYNSL
jgi:hypothetical protein